MMVAAMMKRTLHLLKASREILQSQMLGEQEDRVWNNRSEVSSMQVGRGAWVRLSGLFPGIWQIADVIEVKEQRWSLAEPPVERKRTSIFCHRLVNDIWKRSFSYTSCDVSWARELSVSDQRQLEAFRAENPALQTAFGKYKAKLKPLDAIANVGFGGMSAELLGRFSRECDLLLAHRIERGITLEDFLLLLQGSELEPYMSRMPNQRTLQLVCSGHELRDDQFLYCRFNILPS